MAGFDLEIRCSDKQKSLMKALLNMMQRLGAARDCEIRYRWLSSNKYYVTADGRLPNLQSLVAVLFHNLRPFAEGYVEPISRRVRLKAAEKLCFVYLERLETFSKELQNLADELGAAPSSFIFFPGKATHLKGKLREFTRSLFQYWEGHLTSTQMAEEAHTILELLLKNAVRNSKKYSFTQLVESAHKARLIDSGAKEALMQLKNLRRNAKHRGQSIRVERMDKLAPIVVSAAQALTRVIREEYEG